MLAGEQKQPCQRGFWLLKSTKMKKLNLEKIEEIEGGSGGRCALAVAASSIGLLSAYAPALLALGPVGFGITAGVALAGGIAGMVMADSCE